MESILEFMYLGVATFYQERMNEFLNVANSLEIKEISKNVEFDDNNVNNEEQEISNNETNLETESQTKSVTDSTRSKQLIDSSQVQRTSEGVRHACNQCNQELTGRGSLYNHIKSKHEGVKYACTQCDYQGTYQDNLKIHIK